MRAAWVISIGTELTHGQIVDTNGAWLSAELAELGLRTQRHVTIPDDVGAIETVILEAATASDVVLVTGGLGPTDDDLTRQALAHAAGVELQLHPPTLEHLREFFAARKREMSPANAVQAMVPQTGTAIPNQCGTAPGLRIELRGTPCYALPGVPFEMRDMFAREVAPALRLIAGGACLRCRQLHTFGLGESGLGERIADLMERGRNPEIGTTASHGVVSIRISATAASRDDAEAQLDEAESELRRRLGEVVFGRDDETLASVVAALLVERGGTLSTAESCTGGLIGAMLTDVAGSSRYYLGGAITYANTAKVGLLGVPRADLEQHGAVSERVALTMASEAAERFRSDYGISVTGIAGPTGGTPQKPVGLVYVGLHTPQEAVAREFQFGRDTPRPAIRLRAARSALNMLRLQLLRASGKAAHRTG